MKRISMLICMFVAAAIAVSAPAARAQDHGEVGVFADYYHLNATHTDYAGLGARVSVNTWRYIQIEAEMNYDFNQTFTESFRNPSTEVVTVAPTNLRILHGLFGPKFQTGRGPFRFFVTVKGGFDNFRIDPRPASFGTFASSVQDLRASNVDAALYPGGGIEAFVGPIGLRAEVGDEIYFTNYAHNNWRFTFGPTLRF
jgi:hypothetical protein